MDSESTTQSKKTMAIKIIIPILFIAVVIGIWAVKNNKKELNSVNTDKPNEVISENSNLKDIDNPDFELHVTQKINLEKLKSYGVPIVIDFGAYSCIPCKEMAPVLKELNSELKGKAIIKFVDVWKYQEFSDGYPISLIPTQILIDAKGKPYIPKDPQALPMKQYLSKDTGEHILTAHEGGLKKEQLLSTLKEMGMR